MSYPAAHNEGRAAIAGPSAFADEHGSIGIAAHITAAVLRKPRYEPSLSFEQLGSVSNGVWLLDNHAREVDE